MLLQLRPSEDTRLRISNDLISRMVFSPFEKRWIVWMKIRLGVLKDFFIARLVWITLISVELRVLKLLLIILIISLRIKLSLLPLKVCILSLPLR